VLSDVRVALVSQQLQGEERQQVARGRQGMSPRETCVMRDIRDTELGEEGGEEEYADGGGLEALPVEGSELDEA